MPPPPPPSKSYLLRFDSSSEDESSHSSSDEEERERERERRRLQEKREQIIRNLKIAKQEQEKREREREKAAAAVGVEVEVKTDAVKINDTGGDDDSEDDDLKEDVSTTPKKKKKKRKKKRRKKKKGAGDREENNLTTDADNDTEIDIHADPVTENETKAETFSGADDVTNATVKSASDSDPSTCTMKTSQTQTQRQTKVKFQNVQVAEFIRDVGGNGIPADGGYPLCLSDVNTTSYNIPIDTFETKKQIGLRERYTQQVFDRRMRQWKKEHENKDSGHGNGHGHHGRRRKRSNSINSKPKSGHDSHHNNHSQNNQNHSKSNNDDSHDRNQNMPHLPVFIPEGYEFETRQFDYKPRRDDKHRHWLINTITSSSNGKEELDLETKSEWKEIKDTGRNTLFGQLHESERKQLLLRDAEAGAGTVPTASTTENEHVSSSSPSGKKSRSTRRRKGSISSQHDCDYQDQSHQTFATETCTASSISSTIHDSTHIKHIRNELEKIRIQRTAEDAAGCSCRKLYVSVGKGSHHHRRLTERRVKDELRKRHVSIPTSLSTNNGGGKSKKGDASSRNAMREQLEQMLHDIVEREGCCYGNDCICVRNGVGCNANTCSCWHASHGGHGGHHPSTSSSTSPYQVSIEDAKRNCGNANGMYMTDFEQIDAYRRKYITALQKEDYCRDTN